MFEILQIVVDLAIDDVGMFAGQHVPESGHLDSPTDSRGRNDTFLVEGANDLTAGAWFPKPFRGDNMGTDIDRSLDRLFEARYTMS